MMSDSSRFSVSLLGMCTKFTLTDCTNKTKLFQPNFFFELVLTLAGFLKKKAFFQELGMAGAAIKARRRRVRRAAVSAGALGLLGGGTSRRCMVEGPGAGWQGLRVSARSPPPPISARVRRRRPGLMGFSRPARRGAVSARWQCRNIKSVRAWRLLTFLSPFTGAGSPPCSGRMTLRFSCRW